MGVVSVTVLIEINDVKGVDSDTTVVSSAGHYACEHGVRCVIKAVLTLPV